MKKPITTSLIAGFPKEQAPPMPSHVPPPMPVPSPTMEMKVTTAPVTRDIRINTLMQLPEEAKVMDEDAVA
jgi:hypothetical protein